MLADEKLVSERLAQERDNAEKNARQNETKVCFHYNWVNCLKIETSRLIKQVLSSF